MKKYLKKCDFYYMIGTFILLVLVHFPLISKNIVGADILLNNYFYNGYSWEVSLGRFGLYIIGIIKSYLTIPHIDFFISSIIICFIIYYLFKLFEINNKFSRVLFILFFVLSPFTSVTLTFNYCSIAYFLAFLCGVLSLYFFYNINNKYLKYFICISLIVISLSMYQAYLSLIVTLYVIYHIVLLLKNKINFKDTFKYLFVIFSGVVIYFVLMKLSQFVLHIDMSNYSNADKIGISTLLNIPSKIGDAYILFYEFFFKNNILKNTHMHNNLIYFVIFVMVIINTICYFIKNKVSIKNIVIVSILLLFLPIFLNCVLFVINDSKLQLLMSASYMIIPLYILSINNYKYINYILVILSILLLRNYLVQDQATYLSLENLFNKYNTVIGSAIKENINDLDNKFVIIGNINDKDVNPLSNIKKYNYGYIADYDLFWDEYNLRELFFERFVYEYYGLEVNFCSEDEYLDITKNRQKDVLYSVNDVIVIDFNNI